MSLLRKSSFLAALFSALCLSAFAAEQASGPKTYVLEKSNASALNCDLRDYGVLTGLHNWTPPKFIEFGKGSSFVGAWNGPTDLSGRLVMQIDEKDLRLYAEILDDDPFRASPGADIWRRDGFELFLSPLPHPDTPEFAEGDAQIQIRLGDGKSVEPSFYITVQGADGKRHELKPEGCQVVVKEREISLASVSGKGYALEAKIPLALFPALKSNKLGYFNFALFICDLDSSGKFCKAIVGGSPDSFRSTEGYITGFIYEPREIRERVVDVGPCAKEALTPKANVPASFPSKDVPIWDMSILQTKSLPGRESFCLSGLWGVQTFPNRPERLEPSKWKYMLLPLDPHFFQGGETPYFELKNGVLSSSQSLVADQKGQRFRFHCREIELPSSWEGKSVFLSVDNCGTSINCRYYVDGKLVSGKDEVVDRLFDLTPWLKPGRKSMLVIEARATVKDARAIALGDIWLHGVSGRSAFESCVAETSVKSKTLSLETRIDGALPEGAKLKATVREWAGGKEALEIPAKDVKSCRSADGLFKLSASWPEPKLWSPSHPDLYVAKVSLVDASGAALDSVERRFGFREIEISGRDILLNGIPFHVKAMHSAYYRNDREDLEHLKKLGWNTLVSFCEPCPEYYSNWMDELGMTAILQIGPEMTAYNFGVFDKNPNRKEWLRRFKGHPSSLLWLANLTVIGYEAGWVEWNYHVIGTNYFPDKSREGAETLAKNREIDAWFQEADTSVPVVDYCSGNQGKVSSVMSHSDFGIPLQEGSGFAESWTKCETARPLVAMESWIIPTGFNLDLLRGRYKNVPPKFETREEADVNLMVEELSQYLGPKAYEIADPVRCFKYQFELPGAARSSWDMPASRCVSESGEFYSWRPKASAEIAMASLAMREQARGDRGNGLSGRNYFSELSVSPEDPIVLRKPFSLRAVSFQRWMKPLSDLSSQRDKMLSDSEGGRLSSYPAEAFSSKGGLATMSSAKNLWPERFNDATSPVLVFIGGGPAASDFRRKDHAFASGEKVEKHVVAVNDTEKPLRLKVAWKLVDEAGLAKAQGSLNVDVPAGGVAKAPFSFVAPEVSSKSSCKLELSANDASSSVSCADSFALELWPALKNPGAGLKVFCFDPKGLTSASLKRLGVTVEPVVEKGGAGFFGRLFGSGSRSFDNLPSDATLVVGREALDAFLAASGWDLDKKVQEGLRLLVMEQGLDSSLGPVSKEIRLRDQFVKDPSHPVLAGFSDADFSQWRGESTLVPSHPAWDPASEYTEYNNHQMFGKWGTEGVVSALPFRRPQHGNFRTLLSGGFDQEWASLVELQRGEGVMTLCQLDVDGRSQNDPVADRLLLALIKRLDSYEAPSFGGVFYAGGDDAARWLDRFKPRMEKDASDAKLIVVGNGGDESLKKSLLEREVKRGGKTLLALWPASQDDLKWLGLPVEISKTAEHDKQLFKVCVSKAERDASFLRGFNSEDFHYRFRRPEIPLVKSVPAGGSILANGLFAEIPCGKGRVVICQLDPAWHEGERSFSKVVRSLSCVLDNFDVALERPLRLSDSPTDLSRREWKFAVDPADAGEAAGWFKPDFDDSAWRTLKTGRSWESQGVTEVNPHRSNPPFTSYNGTGWHRLSLDVPKEFASSDLFLEIGSIAGADEIWFNGVSIGKTLASEGVSNYYRKCPRVYRIPASLVKERGNLIAVKAFCPGGVGGISKWPVKLSSEAMPLPSIPTPMEKDRKFGDPYRYVMW